MAITAYTGPPGAGKSYAMVSQVIVPAVLAGRRVVTNIDGINPEKVRAYCLEKSKTGEVGEVVTFHGEDAAKADFFPTEDIPDTGTFIKGGDLIVFDEWGMHWPRRGQHKSEDLQPFLRWHRHLVDGNGQTCDVIIGTQLATDIHGDYRGLVERSYKFRKLSAVGMNKTYQYDVYEGHLQNKGTAYQKGNGRYRKEIFALYSSFDSGADGVESRTDARSAIWSKGVLVGSVLVVLMLGFGLYGTWSFFFPDTGSSTPDEPQPFISQPMEQVQTGTATVSNYRIVGQLVGDLETLVILSDGGSTRLVSSQGFEFRNGRPVSGVVDGRQVFAEDRVVVTRGAGIIELPNVE